MNALRAGDFWRRLWPPAFWPQRRKAYLAERAKTKVVLELLRRKLNELHEEGKQNRPGAEDIEEISPP